MIDNPVGNIYLSSGSPSEGDLGAPDECLRWASDCNKLFHQHDFLDAEDYRFVVLLAKPKEKSKY